MGDLVGTRGGEFGIVISLYEGLSSPYRVRVFTFRGSVVFEADDLCRAVNNFAGFVRCGALR